MIYGLTHIELPCRDLERAAEFYRVHVGLPELGRGEVWIDLEAGSLKLRLRQHAGAVQGSAVIHLQTGDVDAAAVRLTAGGATLEQPPARAGERLEQAVVRDHDGHLLVLWRELGEDELDAPPPLDVTVPWTPEGEQTMQALLGHVPAPFRALARGRAVPAAEALARQRGQERVDGPLAAQAYVQATPWPMRKRAYRALEAEGFDPSLFPCD